MAKFCGKVGFVETVETSPGRWEEIATEKQYHGDITRNIRKWEPRETINDDLNINNIISIFGKDSYVFDHVFAIRYIWWRGAKWCVTNIEVSYPRLILTIGGLYNG